jgi:hypothetical protein
LPPPDTPESAEISADGSSVVLSGGGALPGALVIFFNDEPTVQAGTIVTARPNGSYVATVPTDLRTFSVNQMEMWQRRGTQDSSVVVFLVPLHGSFAFSDAGVPSDAADDGAHDEASSSMPNGDDASD